MPTRRPPAAAGEALPAPSGADSDDADLELDRLLLGANVQGEAASLLYSSLPVILSTTTQLLIMVPLMSAVGGLGRIALASMNLVSIYSGLAGMAPLSGLAMALDSLCSQAYTAASDRRLLGLYLQRVLVAVAVTLVAIYPLWWNAQPIYRHLGVPEEIAQATGRMLRLYFFGVAGMFVYECLKSYLFAQGIRRFAPLAQAICLPASWLCIWLFVSNPGTSMGFLGIPCVIIVTAAGFNLVTLVFISRVDGHQCWGGWSRAALVGLGPVFKLGAAGSAITFFESVSLHMIDIGVLFLDASSMAAQAILSTILTGAWFLGAGFAVATCNRVGNLLGAGQPNRALLAVYTALGLAVAVFVPLTVALAIHGRAVAGIFTSDPEVVDIICSHMAWPAMGSAVQGISMAASGVLRGQGRQALTARIRMAAFVCISVPMSALAVAVFRWGLAGLWFSYVAGALLAMCAQVYVVLATDWSKEMELCRRRLSDHDIAARSRELEDHETPRILP
ncbi:ethionine resistance protein [Coemansia biformis]|uniref:Ethionine resistance protein n=1 Tax=Coemansia biformis TaxID=1286918 RepID=A0A9W7YJ33_9FUNG|nr:ethionine resistance protein [Coemansia biformis]